MDMVCFISKLFRLFLNSCQIVQGKYGICMYLQHQNYCMLRLMFWLEAMMIYSLWIIAKANKHHFFYFYLDSFLDKIVEFMCCRRVFATWIGNCLVLDSKYVSISAKTPDLWYIGAFHTIHVQRKWKILYQFVFSSTKPFSV